MSLSLALIRAYGSSQIDLVASTLVPCRQELCQTFCSSFARAHREGSIGFPFSMEWMQPSCTATVTCCCRMEKRVGMSFFPSSTFRIGYTANQKQQRIPHSLTLCVAFGLLATCCRSSRIPTTKGSVHVCLCQNQPPTWRVQEAAGKPIPTSNTTTLVVSFLIVVIVVIETRRRRQHRATTAATAPNVVTGCNRIIQQPEDFVTVN